MHHKTWPDSQLVLCHHTWLNLKAAFFTHDSNNWNIFGMLWSKNAEKTTVIWIIFIGLLTVLLAHQGWWENVATSKHDDACLEISVHVVLLYVKVFLISNNSWALFQCRSETFDVDNRSFERTEGTGIQSVSTLELLLKTLSLSVG